MRSISVFWSYGLGALFALAQSYDYGLGVATPITNRNATSGIIVVEPLPLRADGSIPYRLEIRNLKANKYKWDLYILALSMFQSVNQDDRLSYYQLAGIHGIPFQSWNDVQPYTQGMQAGYCQHASVLFPMWHRPYLTIFEAQLYYMASAIADLFQNETERKEYQGAASDFRMPYWDWSLYGPSGESYFPEDFWLPTISQYGPNGLQTINNPLYSYRFHPLDRSAMVRYPWNAWTETKRAPDTSYRQPPSSNAQVNQSLYNQVPGIQQRLFAMFSSYTDFNRFSNKAWGPQNNHIGADSIESVHDIIHAYSGLNGHMAYVSASAFDPLFFLHHAQTDRLIAMWQILNPDSWITSEPAGEASFTNAQGAFLNASSALYPFYFDKSGKFWDSDKSRTTKAFGYAYADTDVFSGSTKDLQKSLIKKINSWYGKQSPAQLRGNSQNFSRAGRSSTPAGVKTRPNVKPDAKDPLASQIIKNSHYTEWSTQVIVNVEALDGKLSVHMFIGEPPQDPREWETASNLAGTVAILSMHRSTGSDAKISGAVQLTSSLMKMVADGAVPSLDPKAVVPFLTSNLHFRVLGGDNKAVDPRLVDGFHVTVVSADVEAPASDEEFPKWRESVSRLDLWPQI